MTHQSELHNSIVGPIVSSIVKPPIEAGGKPTDVLLVAESVMLGTLLVLAKNGGWTIPQINAVLDTMAERVKERAAQLAALDGPPAGSA